MMITIRITVTNSDWINWIYNHSHKYKLMCNLANQEAIISCDVDNLDNKISDHVGSEIMKRLRYHYMMWLFVEKQIRFSATERRLFEEDSKLVKVE